MAIFGYAGVTTDCQTMAAQLAQLQADDCVMVYFEKAGAAKSRRAELTKALRKLDPADVLVVPSLDGLARSTCDLLNILNALAGKSIGFKSIGDVWADTTAGDGRLMLTVLAGLVEFERELIKGRVARAKARGARLGRPRKLNHYQRKKALARLAAGESQAAVARTYNVDPSTIGALLKVGGISPKRFESFHDPRTHQVMWDLETRSLASTFAAHARRAAPHLKDNSHLGHASREKAARHRTVQHADQGVEPPAADKPPP